MAIRPDTLYPGNVDTTDPVGYPYATAKDVSAPSAGDGTPYTAAWRRDLWGFLQALLISANIVPDGNPDKVGASQYLTALLALIKNGTKYTFSTDNNTAISLASVDHLKYKSLTNASPITVTMLAPSSPFGDSIVLEKVAGSGIITINGDVGITVELAPGGSNVVSVDGSVVCLVSKNATTWRLIT